MNSQRPGFTLIELLMVVVIAALVLAFAVPKFGEMRESGRLSSAKVMMASTVTTARQAAIQNGRVSRWWRQGNAVTVSLRNANGVYQQVGTPVYFDSAYHVSLSTPFDSILYDARGFAAVPNGRIYIRGSKVDSICVTRLGAVMLKGCL